VVALDPDYSDFLLTATKAWQERGPRTDQDYLLKLTEEVGEVAEAFSRYKGTNPAKGPATGHMVPVVQELADVVCTALVSIIHLGFNPNDLLIDQMNKVKRRYPDIWSMP
jgi:NTP pyrophosphatase (non-canonical NTP hydrolase)